MGGKAAHALGLAHEFNSETGKSAGQKGGLRVSQDRAHMAEIGRRGGLKISANKDHMSAIGKKGGAAVSSDPEYMAALGAQGRVRRQESGT